MTYQDLNEYAGRAAQLANVRAAAQTRFLADLVAIRSYSGDEGQAIARTLAELRAIGCDDVWQDAAGNAVGRIGRGSRVMLYDAHVDTVQAGDERLWQRSPWEPAVIGDTMFGLGTADCKGGVAATVYGAAVFKELGLAELTDCTLLIFGATYEEDAEGFALRSFVERDGVRPDAVVIAEPTSLGLRRGQRGRCEVRVRTEGAAAHASRPEQGASALLKMLPVIGALQAMVGGLPTDPVFGRGDQVVTMIEGPRTPNSVPAWCEITVDRRTVPGETSASVLESIRAVVEPLGGQARIPDQPVRTNTGLRLDGPAFYPGWLLSTDDPLLAAGRAAGAALWGSPPPVGVWPFSTDGTYAMGEAGIPTVGFGPQDEQSIHTPGEHIHLSKLPKAAAFLALLPLAYRQVLGG